MPRSRPVAVCHLMPRSADQTPQQIDVSAAVIGPNAPSTLVLTGPLDDPPRWTIVNDGVQIEFW